ncbi:MAG: hypothetical protein ACYC1C_08645 [Chloroflexota bacterium]
MSKREGMRASAAIHAGWRPRGVLMSLAIFAVLGALVAGYVVAGQATRAPAALSAERTTHDFGQVPINGGLLDTQFTLAVGGASHVESILTS